MTTTMLVISLSGCTPIASTSADLTSAPFKPGQVWKLIWTPKGSTQKFSNSLSITNISAPEGGYYSIDIKTDRSEYRMAQSDGFIRYNGASRGMTYFSRVTRDSEPQFWCGFWLVKPDQSTLSGVSFLKERGSDKDINQVLFLALNRNERSDVGECELSLK